MISDQSLKGLERVILVAGALTLVISGFLLISTAFSHFQNTESKAKYDLANSEIASLSSTIEKAKHINRLPTTAKDLSKVQGILNDLSKKNNCQLLEVSATGEAGQYQSKYKKGGEDRGWKQFTIDCQFGGSLLNVMTMVREFASISMPIEIQSIDIMPVGQDSKGGDQVSAKVAFQILKQEVVR